MEQQNYEYEISKLRAENVELSRRIVALQGGNLSKARLSNELDAIKKYGNKDFVAALDASPELSYEYLDKYDPNLLARIRSESSGLYNKLVVDYEEKFKNISK
jgi:hypothetical protein